MKIEVQSTTSDEVESLRALYRSEANCQIIKDSFIGRGLADPYLILVDGPVAGYGAISNKYDPGRLIEFYTFPAHRGNAVPMCRGLIAFSGATSIAAQTNMPHMLMILLDCSSAITCENVLFADSFATNLPLPEGELKMTSRCNAKHIFEHRHEPVGEWAVEANGVVVATAGALCHYNPPYADIFMEVFEPYRRRGYGSYLVQEVKRICYESGKIPSARCDADNIASRMTLQKAGLLPCGRVLVGNISSNS